LLADLPIVVHGETGAGKEGVAQAIHTWSGRDGRLVPVNCAAIPVQLAESELFGYKRGAFSGADRDSPGLILAAHGGTLFLDEILELPAEIQAKLLRAIGQREVLPLGETKPIAIDLLVVIATQESLASVVNEGRLRKDLFGRIDGLTINLPALRDRREDIGPLLVHFLRQYAGNGTPALEAKLVEALCVYDWPLNVRELLRVTQQLLAVHGHEPVLKRSYLPDRIRERSCRDSGVPTSEPSKRAWRPTDDESEFEALLSALRDYGGNVTKAAAAIGINRSRAYRLLRAHPDLSAR
jgi:transcriptional regulator with PAS, ATPase and Fis domain